MSHEIRRVRFPDDAPALEMLFAEYLQALFERAPELRAEIAAKYDPETIPDQVAEFARIHARPQGELLLAEVDGAPAGCAMLRQFEPGVAEILRVFVDAAVRGRGLGRALTEALVERARDDGYALVRLDTGCKQAEAIGLYTALGFRECAPYHDNTQQLDHVLRYFELVL